ncbi:MAG: hypothetical protein QM786_18270 [Breznakibacter sp.]
MSKKSHHDTTKDEEMADNASDSMTEQPIAGTADGDPMAGEQQIAEETQKEQANFGATLNELNQKIADLNDKHLRLSAEFEQFPEADAEGKNGVDKIGRRRNP